MPRLNFAGLLCLLCLVVLSPDGGALAQNPQRPFSAVVEQWERAFNAVGQEADRGDVTAARAEMLKKTLVDIAAAAKEIRQSAQSALDPLQEQLEALGPPPAEGMPPEAPEIAAQRAKIAEDIADYQARVQRAALATARANELIKGISARSFERSIERLFQAYPVPLAPATAARAAPEFLRDLAAIGRSPLEWWRSLSGAEQRTVLYRALLILAPALVLAWLIRRALLRFCGRDPAIQNPTYARRLSSAIAVGLADGMVPSVILASIIYRQRSDANLMSGQFAEAMTALCGVLIMFVLAWALPRAVLAPDLPAWRLVPVSPDNARIISRRIIYLAAVFAVDIFIVRSSPNTLPTDELISLYVFVFGTLEAIGIVLLIQGRLWRWEEEDRGAATSAPEPPAATGGLGFWTVLRRIVGLLVIVALVAAVFGYANVVRYVIENLVVSGMAIGILFLVRGLIREAIGAALRSRVMQDTLAIPHKSRNRYKFWLRATLNLAAQLGGLVMLLVIWGVPAKDIYAWTRQILQEFTIGNVTISLSDIIVGVLIFIAAMALTRAAQRLLSERVFPQTSLDTGIQNSLSAGLGYVGLAIAIMLAVSAIGLDLSNLALIAGALSVGIGFGLQNVVNNFVSGLILLVERPIKVGDWIVVGGYEGTVKRINVRATEIETFQRASIIVPNSEMISGAVTNWTHKDRYGRVEVPVGVAYGSDVQNVMTILKTCLTDHPNILPWPEPYVLFLRFGESSLDFEARGYIGDVAEIVTIGSELHVAIDRAFREAGIEIPFPQRDLHIRGASDPDMAARQRLAASAMAPVARTAARGPETQISANPDSGADD